MTEHKRGHVKHSCDDAVVWDRREPVTPAGRPSAGAARIAAAGVELADRNGLYGVSVKRVASRLGVNATVIEDFVATKDDLLDLMLDAALGEIALPQHGPGEDWRVRLRAVACATQDVIERHPWLRALAGTRTPSGPNGLRVSESVLAAMAGLGLSPIRMLQLANTVLAYVYGFTQLEMSHQPRGTKLSETAHRANTARHLVVAAASGDYPNLAALFAAEEAPSAQDAFDIGLAIVLDGVAAQLEPVAAFSGR